MRPKPLWFVCIWTLFVTDRLPDGNIADSVDTTTTLRRFELRGQCEHSLTDSLRDNAFGQFETLCYLSVGHAPVEREHDWMTLLYRQVRQCLPDQTLLSRDERGLLVRVWVLYQLKVSLRAGAAAPDPIDRAPSRHEAQTAGDRTAWRTQGSKGPPRLAQNLLGDLVGNGADADDAMRGLKECSKVR